MNELMNTQVQEFVEAVKANARQVWNGPDDKEFVDGLLYIDECHLDGSITVSDNYEHFFDTIYRVTSDGEWSYRRMWSESSVWKPYTFVQAMSDASILYTG